MTVPVTTLAPYPVFKAFDNNGNQLYGGLLYTYAAGTTTPQATYTDSTGGTANTNPVVLNARGECNLWLTPNQAYKLVLTDSLGNTIWTVDQVNSTSSGNVTVYGNFVPATSNTYTLGTSSSSFANAYFGLSPSPVYDSISGRVGGYIPQTVAEAAASVTPINYFYAPGQPERYATMTAGQSPYCTSTTGTGGSGLVDFAGPINTALSCGQQAVTLGPYLYLISSAKITMPNEQKLVGQGLNVTGICCSSSANFTAAIYQQGVSSKIELRGFTLYCNTALLISAGIKLGTSSNPYGTEGFIDQVMVRDLTSGALAFDIYANVGEFGSIYALNSAGIRIQGSGISIYEMENTNASGFVDSNGNYSCTQLQDAWVGFYEIEAPQSNNILLTMQGQVLVDCFIPSFALSTTFAQLVDISASTTSWKCNIPQIYYGGSSGTYATFTGLFYDRANTNLWGGSNPSNTASLKSMCGMYQSGLMTGGYQFGVRKQQLNAFTIRLTNTSGTIQHGIGTPGAYSTAGNFITSVSGATNSLVNTPTGTDSSTAFANGAKISSTNTNCVILNTGAEIAGDALMLGVITYNTTGTAYNIQVAQLNSNVNGTTKNRVALFLVNATTGANVAWSTALGSSTYTIDVTCIGFCQ